MESVKNIFLIVVLISLIVVVCVAFFRGLSNDLSASKNEPEDIKDYRYQLVVKTPDGKKLSEMRIHGEIAPKPIRGGFYFKDVEGDMIFDVRNDGSVKYYKGSGK
jgi:outer membrane lipoprotein-sorting protein